MNPTQHEMRARNSCQRQSASARHGRCATATTNERRSRQQGRRAGPVQGVRFLSSRSAGPGPSRAHRLLSITNQSIIRTGRAPTSLYKCMQGERRSVRRRPAWCLVRAGGLVSGGVVRAVPSGSSIRTPGPSCSFGPAAAADVAGSAAHGLGRRLAPAGPAVRLGSAPAAGAEETGGWFPCAARRLSSGGEIEAGRCTLECSRGVRRARGREETSLSPGCARGCSCSCSCAPAGSRTKLVASRVTSSSRAIRGRGQAGGPRHRQQRWHCLAVRPVRRARIAYVGDWPDVPGHARVAAACGDTCWWWCRGAGEVGHAKSCATWLVGWGRWDAERACFRKALCLEIRTVLHLGLCCWATACLDVRGACLTSTVAVSAL
ncbi:hypothetical protein GQ55_3G271400 [Panicum hallii var. hallii]|uniref:Uncharacterized protein n=1 Tax=Panicum hallii var. hallii TaxID=1504633 RepID=A0A2T7EDU6_9POAL|nr:hypothetical protein GQ55_3G271400 [Panicum hallii var. hallii]